MKTSVMKAIALILSADAELLDILSVTAEMSIQSSVFALLIGLPIGIWLGACKFPGRNVLLVANRTLMGMPPVVCGLLFYMLFSGVGPFRHLKLLFTVKIMIMAQIVLITPIVVGNMEISTSAFTVQVSLLKLACEGDNLLAQHYQLQCGFLQFGDKGKCPLITEVGFYGSHRLIVVVADGLELMIEIREAYVVIHSRLIEFYHLYFTLED